MKHFCKKPIAIFVFLFFLGLCACDFLPEQPVTPTNTPEPTVTNTPKPTTTNTPKPTATNTPKPTATNTPKPTATNTPRPTATNTPKPTATNTPRPTATNTPKPTATNTPKPTATNTPKPTATNTPKPTATNTPKPATANLPEIVYKENTILEDTCFTSEAEASRFFFEKVLDGYYEFGILAEDISMLHSAEEYMQMFPAILSMELESLTKYHNGYYLRFCGIELYPIDAEHVYTIRTKDTSYLDATELAAHQKLLSAWEALDTEQLSDIDTIVAVHNYLVLNTAYDEPAAAAADGGPSHYVEGTLLSGKAVCSGYASTFHLFMMLADIPCEYVTSETHAWNLVQLEDEWYHIDATWDDPVPDTPGRVLYTYFMMTDEEVSALDQHENWECECGNSHNCDDTSYRLYPYRDYLCTTEEEAKALLLAQADNDLITLIYPADGVLTQDALLQLVFPTLNYSGSLSYYPAESLGVSHYLLQILLK
ncbi:MAG: hypothetical protein E7260_03505 [Lachnospiraceae bacterium]|nr:hypothetical protein [Lachnospiraceae bacterium]